MVQERPGRRRSEYVAVGACVALIAGVVVVGEVSGSSDDESDDEPGDGYAAVCVDQGGTRVDDADCDDDGGTGAGGARWYYIPSGSSAPAVGQRPAGGGSFSEPDTAGFADVRGGVSPAGESVVRGGFGGHGGEGSVGG